MRGYLLNHPPAYEKHYFEKVLINKLYKNLDDPAIDPALKQYVDTSDHILHKYLKVYNNGDEFSDRMISTLFEDIWYTDMGESSYGLRVTAHGNTVIIDPNTHYELNSDGFRSSEFEPGHDLLIAGCSHTFGVGLKKEFRWPDRLIKMLNVDDYANIGVPGGSTSVIVHNILKYCFQYGNPKKIICLFPNFDRVRLINNKKLMLSNKTSILDDERIDTFDENIDINPGQFSGQEPEFLKLPFNMNDVIPVDYAFYKNAESLKLLINYCNFNKIELVWSTWAEGVEKLFNELKAIGHFEFITKDYQDIGISKLKNTKHNDLNCHLEIKEECGKYFYTAQDKELGNPHWGAHAHMHIAELFKEAIDGRR